MSLENKGRNRWRWTGLAIALLVVGTAVTAGQRQLTDDAIVEAVEEEFLFDAAVPFDDVDVECIEGTITLRGTVDNLLAKDRAARLSETVKGVSAVVNLIDVRKPAAIVPTRLEREVANALLEDPATDSWEIDVEADLDGIVTLTGTTQSWQEAELAETVAKSVRGVTGVKNEIGVRYSTERSDLEIEPEIEQRLRWDALVDARSIDVAVDEGRVTLKGVVGSAAEKRYARHNAWVPGVSSVDDSQLEVRFWARDPDQRASKFPLRSDEQIREAVESALVYDPRVASFNVDVSVRSGSVTLRGVVDNLKAKHAAAEDARQVIGTRAVRNHLKVRPIEPLSDERIEKNVEQALARDPLVHGADVAVEVTDGRVRLEGTVDTTLESARVEDAAFRAKGVRSVANHLEIDRPLRWTLYEPIGYPWYSGLESFSSVADATIRDAIETQLWWSPFVDADQIEVSVDRGVATLTGTVDSWMEYRAAVENAVEGGAVGVDNELVIR